MRLVWRFSPPPGTFAGPVGVTLASPTADAAIFYTLDGSDPSPSSVVYATPIPLSSTMTVKALVAGGG